MPGHEQHHGSAQENGPLCDLLRSEAARHTPDRQRMLARMDQARFEVGRPTDRPSRRARPDRSLRASGLGAAIGTVLVLGGAAAWAVTAYQPDDRPSVRVSDEPLSPPTRISPSATPPGHTPGSSAPAQTGPPPRSHSAAPGTASSGDQHSTAGAPPASSPAPPSTEGTPQNRTQDGFLWSDGSVDPHSTDSWAQSNITLKIAVPVRSLQVEVRIADTPGVKNTGTWTTLDPSSVITEVSDDGSETVYRFTLRPGVVLQPNQYVFAAQYSHAKGGRDAGADRYTAAAGAADGSASATVHGDFY